MYFRTHLTITIFFILLIFPYIQNLIIFIPVAIFATMLPDIDSKNSKLGHYKIFRPLNFFMKHRGITHSFVFLALISFFVFLFSKEILFAFVLGYALHLFGDGFTKEGIMPFYPMKKRIRGWIRTGGVFEILIFTAFFIADLILIFNIFRIL